MSEVKRYDLEQGDSYMAGGAYMREETFGGDYIHSGDYDAQLEKIEKLRAALKHLEGSVMREGLQRTEDEAGTRSAERFLTLMDALRQAREALDETA